MIPVSPMMDGAGINDAILGTHVPLLPETNPRRVSNGGRQERRSSLTTFLPVVVSVVLLLVLLAAVMIFSFQNVDGQGSVMPAGDVIADGGRAVEGVSEKSTGPVLCGAGAVLDYGWTNAMLSWQRTAFHFQPPKSWMNG
jgi:hypothetical protein